MLKCEILFAFRVGNLSVESKSISEGPISIVGVFEICIKLEGLSGGWEFTRKVGGIRLNTPYVMGYSRIGRWM